MRVCGIAGAFDLTSPQLLPRAWVADAAEALRRRGPDAQGVAQAPGLVAAHRRLKVIDLDGSPQPWVDPDSGDVLVYNGELYNYRELRHALAGQGVSFRSAGDTEVLLRALQQWGRDGLKALNGMFAFAWYRARDRRLWLVRDHAGIKPLYFAFVGERGYFASSMAALLTFPGVPRELDMATFSHYLSTIRTTLGARTLVAGVSTLEPGHLLECSPRHPVGTPQRWWSLPAVPAADKTQRPMVEVAEEVRHLTRQAVDRQLVSDVPVGGFLSGGLDSTIIASQVRDLGVESYRCYAVGFAGDDATGNPHHEFAYADLAAHKFGIACQKIELDEADYLVDWQHLVAHKGLPLSTPNEVGIFRLALALGESHKVALSGEGADEIFAGYAVSYASVWDFERAPLAVTWPAVQRQQFESALMGLYGTTQFSSMIDHYLRLNSWIPLGLKYQLLRAESIVAAQHDEPMLRHYHERLSALSSLTPMDRYLHLLVETNLECLLSRLDSSTMAASVESRVPFTDPDLMRAAFHLPDRDKLDFVNEQARREGQVLNAHQLDRAGHLLSKRALREAFRETLPEAILTRPKVAFAVPFRECLAGPWHDFARETLASAELINTLCERGALDYLLEHTHRQGLGMALWPLLNIALWADACGIHLPGDGRTDARPTVTTRPGADASSSSQRTSINDSLGVT